MSLSECQSCVGVNNCALEILFDSPMLVVVSHVESPSIKK